MTCFTLPISVASISICAMFLAFGANFASIPGNTIVESCADCDQKIAILDRVVGKCRAVHAEHVQRQWMRRVKGAKPVQRRYDGNVVVSSRTAEDPALRRF